jgi:acyl-CoA synthetase (AMP-forming)/AMP-acid ligase II
LDDRGKEATFADMHDTALRVAAGLAELGVKNGSVVSWQLPTWIEAATLTLALSRLGAVQNPLVPILGLREVEFICRQAGTDLLVVPGTWRGFDYAEMATKIASAPGGPRILVAARSLPEGDPKDLPARDGSVTPTWYFYTSGTTADPKGAIHSDDTLVAATRGFHGELGITERDRLSMILPLTHVGGIIHLITSLEKGCALVFADVFHPDRTTRQLRDQGATVLPGAVPFLQAFFGFQDRHPELDPLFPAARMMLHGGSSKPPRSHYEAKERLGLPIVSGYGMTECPMSTFGSPEDADEDVATKEGRAAPGIEIAIVRADGERAATGEEGEVRVRGAHLMKGYVDVSLEEDAFDEMGFFRSGDLGRLDERGYLTIDGRLKDIIIRNMENISAIELENLLYTHPRVAAVAVIGIPNVRTGEHVCAVVEPSDPEDPPTLEELNKHLLATGLSNRKLPEQLELVEELPRNAMEKVMKTELRSRFQPREPHADRAGG